MKEKYKEKFKSAGGKVKSIPKRIGSKTKQSFKTTLFNLQYRMDQHIKISEYKKDIEKLIEEKIRIEKEHFQEINLLDVNIILLTKEKDDLKEERDELKIHITALNRALEKLNDNLINTKADLILLKKEYGIE